MALRYRLEAKEDGTWLIIQGVRSSALIRLESVVHPNLLTAKAVLELRCHLLMEQAGARLGTSFAEKLLEDEGKGQP